MYDRVKIKLYFADKSGYGTYPMEFLIVTEEKVIWWSTFGIENSYRQFSTLYPHTVLAMIAPASSLHIDMYISTCNISPHHMLITWLGNFRHASTCTCMAEYGCSTKVGWLFRILREGSELKTWKASSSWKLRRMTDDYSREIGMNHLYMSTAGSSGPRGLGPSLWQQVDFREWV